MNNFTKFFSPLLLLTVVSCSSFSEIGKVMRNEKINTTDEFLVKKKEPLKLPPDFSKMPEPGSLEQTKKDDLEKEKIEKVLQIKKEKIKDNKSSGTIEESVLNKIGK
jgi:hypothetical protein